MLRPVASLALLLLLLAACGGNGEPAPRKRDASTDASSASPASDATTTGPGGCRLRGRGPCTRSEHCCEGLVCTKASDGADCQPGCEAREDCPEIDLRVEGKYCVACRASSTPCLGQTDFDKSCVFVTADSDRANCFE